MPSFRCADIGVRCGFETAAPTKEELLLKIGMRASDAHKMTSVPQDILRATNKAIRI
jgi:predicted small metal-binding protein